jgi:hypothetical protein
MLGGIKFAFEFSLSHDTYQSARLLLSRSSARRRLLMKKVALILFTLLTIGVIAPAAQAQWRYYYPNWGYYPYYPYYWGPFYDYPVVVYDPVAARQIDIRDSLAKLNEARNRLVSLTSASHGWDTKEIKDQAQKVVRYSKRLANLLGDRDFPDAEPNFAGQGADRETIRGSAQTIDSLVAQLNSTDINTGEVVNVTRTQQTVHLLKQIESYARGIERLTSNRG